MSHPIILIPARLASSRLPRKPLADIHGEPMIVHVGAGRSRRMWGRAGGRGRSAVVEAIKAVGGRVVMTRTDHTSGSDRIFEALGAFDPEARHGIVVNLQGDLPTIDAAAMRGGGRARRIRSRYRHARDPEGRQGEFDDPNVVKVVGARIGARRLRALYFTRARAPWGEGPLLHHIGLYAYRRAALARFIALPPSPLELRERLEQLRALEAGMRIDVALVDVAPLGVDTPDDLRRARERLAPQGKS